MKAARPFDREAYVQTIKEQRDVAMESVAILRGQLAAADETIRLMVTQLERFQTAGTAAKGDTEDAETKTTDES